MKIVYGGGTVLLKGRKRRFELEAYLSKFNHQTVNPTEQKAYLVQEQKQINSPALLISGEGGNLKGAAKTSL